MTLYDLEEKKKLSEDFHFDFLRDLAADLRPQNSEGTTEIPIEPEVTLEKLFPASS